MTFVPENDLERFLVTSATQEAARPQFYRLLLESELFVLGEIVSQDIPLNTPSVAQENTRIRFRVAQRDGHEYILLFTSLQRLSGAIKDEQSYVRMKGRDIFQATPGAYYFLNPTADYGKELLPDEIANLLTPPTHEDVRYFKDTQVIIGQPKVQPMALLEALCALFADRPDVRAAYIAQIDGLPGMDAHPLLGVETTGNWTEISAEISRVVSNGRFGHTVDVVPIERGNPNAALSNSLLDYPPFYMRPDALH